MTMRYSTGRGIQTLKSLLLFAAYIAALWGTTWYNLHYYSGTYNTVVTDILLTIAFAVTFFYPIAVPQKPYKGITVAVSSMSLTAAVLCLFVLHP